MYLWAASRTTVFFTTLRHAAEVNNRTPICAALISPLSITDSHRLGTLKWHVQTVNEPIMVGSAPPHRGNVNPVAAEMRRLKKLLLSPALLFLTLPDASAQSTIVSGRVIVADGGQLPDRVVIQRDCGGAAQTVASADRKGQFSFPLSETGGFDADASSPFPRGGGRVPGEDGTGQSASQPLGTRDGSALAACQLHAVVPGYRSDFIPLDGRRTFPGGSYDVGTIILHRTADAEQQSLSPTSAAAPSAARKAFEKGMDALGKGKTADAEKNFEKAASLYPQYAEAWLDLGKLRLQEKAEDAAAEAFQHAWQADRNLVEPQVYLGMFAVEKKQWSDAVKYLDPALKLDPVHFPEAWFNDAVAEYNLRNYAEAERNVREALKLDPEHRNPRSDYLLGLIFAAKKDYSGAAEQLRTYLKLAPGADDAAKVQTQLDEIEKLQTPNHP